MGENSKISWTHHTFNPWIGCTKIAAGCANCYADAQDKLRKWTANGWGAGQPRKRTSEANWKQPLKWDREAKEAGERRRVFCASLADWLDAEVPDTWRADLFALIEATPNLDWLLLTKRIGNEQDTPWLHWAWERGLRNIWAGVSIAEQQDAETLIPTLMGCPAAVHFISVEPLISKVDLREVLAYEGDEYGLLYSFATVCPPSTFWVIIGGESGGKRREMPIEAARSMIEQCKSVGIPVFIKQDSAFRSGEQGRFTNEEFALKQFPKAAF